MSNSRQASPDVADDEQVHRPSNMEQDVPGHGQHVPGAAAVRRDENSISFRHFLQPHSDVVPSPAPTCRSRNRGTQSGAVDLVDMAMALPDFVQDHLVVESLAIADQQSNGGSSHSGASVDLNVLHEILPDFATSQPTHSIPAHSVQSRRRNIPEEVAAIPEVHGAACAGGALPDFLSDGPMQCTDSNAPENALAASSVLRAASRIAPSSGLTERSRVVDEPLRSTSFDSSEAMRTEIERLRRELTERNRRVSQLEGEILRLRTNVSGLESALRAAEQKALVPEGARTGAGDAVVASSSGSIKVNGKVKESREVNAQEVLDIAQSSETLISQLLQNMARLKGFSHASKPKADHVQKASDEDDDE